MKIKTKKQKIYCRGCGRELIGAETFQRDSYCRIYGCCCCPDSKSSPCQKEKYSGGILENLAKLPKLGSF